MLINIKAKVHGFCALSKEFLPTRKVQKISYSKIAEFYVSELYLKK